MTFGIQLLMYLTPVIYPVSAVPDAVSLGRAAQSADAGVRRLPARASWASARSRIGQLAVSFGVMLVVLAIGLMLFTRVERTFMDTV